MKSNCYCGLPRPPEGRCAHGAPPQAARSHLSAQKKKRQANDRRAVSRTGYVTPRELDKCVAPPPEKFVFGRKCS